MALANHYPGVVHPQGHLYLKQFRLDPFPIFTYEAGGVEVEKSIFLAHGQNTTVIQYQLRVPQGETNGRPVATSCRLEVRPLIAFHDYHATTRENGALNREIQVKTGLASITPYAGLPTLHLAHDANEVNGGGYWYRNFEYAVERERGLDFIEDLYSPFALKFDLSYRADATIIASTEKHSVDEALSLRHGELKRRAGVVTAAPAEPEAIGLLTAAAEQYIVARGQQKSLIAGYHWFSDWGRDTMIALPGLTLVPGRPEIARSILLAFAAHVD